MKYDPTRNYGEQEGSRFDDNIPPGEYLMVGKFIVYRRTSGYNGAEKKDYALIKYEIIKGPAKGATFWTSLWLNLEKEGSEKRLGWHCQACRVNYQFDANDDGQLAKAILLQPFKALVKKDYYKNKPQNKISRYCLNSNNEVSSEDIREFEQWKIENEDLEPKWKDSRDEQKNVPPLNDNDNNDNNDYLYKNANDDDVIPF
jgi:hypothetical protein